MKFSALVSLRSQCLFWAALAFAGCAQAQTYTYSNQQPYRTADFANSLGIGIHMGQTANSYGSVAGVVSAIDYLDFKHVRDTVGGTQTGGVPKFQQFMASGIYSDAIVMTNPFTAQAALDTYAPYLETIEGPNEVDENNPEEDYKGLTGIASGTAIQEDLYPMAHADTNLAGKPVLAMSMAFPANTTGVNVAAYCDYANVHAYVPNGRAPYLWIPAQIAETVDAPGKPVIMTETGLPTDNPDYPPLLNNNMVNEDVQAKYELDTVSDNFISGVVKTYLYELFDENPDANVNNQNHFGQFHTDGTPKPAATGFHNLLAILNDPGAAAATFTTVPLSYSIQESLTAAGMDFNNFHALMQKQDGTYELVIWAEPALWTQATATEITNNPANVITINLNNSYQTIKIYDPMQSSAAIGSFTNTDTVQVLVTDHPIVVELGAAVVPGCGAAAGVASATMPTANLCNTGAASGPVLLYNSWRWACTLGGESASCLAPAIVNGACGSANGTATAQKPATGLCSSGTPSAVAGSGPWAWSCAGLNQGTTATCSALPIVVTSPVVNPPVNGVCGAANAANLARKPVTGLCYVGTASSVAGTGPWSWSCAGFNKGATSTCSTASSQTSAPVTFAPLTTIAPVAPVAPVAIDSPAVNLPAAQTISVKGTLHITGISISDSWAQQTPGRMALGIHASSGALAMTGATGSGTDHLLLYGTLAQLNAALSKLQYTAPSSPATVTLRINPWNRAGRSVTATLPVSVTK